ncbi:DUF1566 domain-containing protein [Desulfocapsa sp. AH-315-G09]|uniref:DUF1566 domain-containing protein n=1 Tax=Desulfotalea psychrophila TaxID=84980 RepID=A0ABS3ASS4_9BACT|nr:DUF1566 domain-containing protein [Desulfocapsa sp.]MBN4065448.1 DUF1566 domain-containing protein [Desulfocapsa sp. AH-315-G09]MBN4068165.1 DUF1566 domain-containing protein [Desulfotalea psychrophila]
MGMFQKLEIGDTVTPEIDWEMTPDMTFGTFESWGGREQMRSNVSASDRVYYFFIDNWEDEPKLCLMERGVKHARVAAEIRIPLQMLADCIKSGGTSSVFEKSYAINDEIKAWLIGNVLQSDDASAVIPLYEEQEVEDMGSSLPLLSETDFKGEKVSLPVEHSFINDDELADFLGKWNFYDGDLNSDGSFENSLVDPNDGRVVVDQRTGLMWQRAGLDITAVRSMKRKIEQLNKDGFAGFHDWRMPTMEEAMSLMNKEVNSKDIHLNLCFSKEQPFIFVNAQRKPGGYWYVDYKHGRAFWSSGTIPGGFARLCRTV